jgi:hypothetical protein
MTAALIALLCAHPDVLACSRGACNILHTACRSHGHAGGGDPGNVRRVEPVGRRLDERGMGSQGPEVIGKNHRCLAETNREITAGRNLSVRCGFPS